MTESTVQAAIAAFQALNPRELLAIPRPMLVELAEQLHKAHAMVARIGLVAALPKHRCDPKWHELQWALDRLEEVAASQPVDPGIGIPDPRAQQGVGAGGARD